MGKELFGDILMYDETLFTDETVLDYEFIPEELPERDNEVSDIAESIKPLFTERRGANLFIHGKPGAGKTVSVKHVFNELKKMSNEVMPVYINCWSNQTTHAISLELAGRAGLLFPPKGVPTEEIMKSALKKLNEKKGVVICLDEADRIKELSALYLIINELSNSSMLLITNHSEWKEYLEPRLQSRLNLRNLEFRDYNNKEMYDILSKRAGMALKPGVIDKELIMNIAGESGGDVRRGMSLILESARMAERDASRTIKKEHVTSALSRTLKKIQEPLNDEEARVLKAISSNNGKVSGVVYEAYLNDGGELSMRSFRRYIASLEKAGLIKTEETKEGFQGKSRKLWIKS